MKNKTQLAYQKANILLMNFTFRKKYDYFLYCRLQKVYEEHQFDRNQISRNQYIKQALQQKIEREAQGIFLEVPKHFLAPFPKEEQVKIQFSFSVNRKTEKVLQEKLELLMEQGVPVLDYLRDAVYERMMSEKGMVFPDGFYQTGERITLTLHGKSDADILSCLRKFSSWEERENFIKQSLRAAIDHIGPSTKC